MKMVMLWVCTFLCCLLPVTFAAPENWFTQKLDHFNNENHGQWKQRYFVSDTYYQPGGPAFLQIGGEGPANPVWLEQGHCIDLAKDVGALVFILEHRFYGESHPTSDTSVPNLKYLTSEQALADLARFIVNKTSETGISTWITFGGSYPGSLSLWAKLKYPNLIQGAMSASAPLLAKMNFFEYNEVVNRSLTTYGGTECVKSISIATQAVQKMLKIDEGRKELKDIFDLCEPLAAYDDEYFQSTVYDPFAETVQYNRDNRAFEGATGGNVTIYTVCKHMTDKTLGSELQRYASIPSLFGSFYDRKRVLSRRYKTFNYGQGRCVDASYHNFIESMKKPVFDASRTWTFQTCTEFGWFQSTDSTHQPFKGFPVGMYTDMCIKIFGSEFDPDNINNGISETNTNYGARKVAEVVTNAYLFNGGVDPWHAMSYVPTSNGDSRLPAKLSVPGPTYVDPTFHTIFVPSSAHCAIMYPDHPDDPPELREARALATKYVKSWL